MGVHTLLKKVRMNQRRNGEIYSDINFNFGGNNSRKGMCTLSIDDSNGSRCSSVFDCHVICS